MTLSYFIHEFVVFVVPSRITIGMKGRGKLSLRLNFIRADPPRLAQPSKFLKFKIFYRLSMVEVNIFFSVRGSK
ncbi:hypothetical protein GCM10028791_05060 [Echinicola sediminis]